MVLSPCHSISGVEGALLSSGNGFGVPDRARKATKDANFGIPQIKWQHIHNRVNKTMVIDIKKGFGESKDGTE